MLTLLNEAAILLLAGFVLVSSICRVNLIHASTVRFRYVAVPVLCAIWAVSVVVTMLNGDEPNWYQSFGLLVASLVLFNDKHEWLHGVPEHATRAHLVDQYGPIAGDRRARIENAIVIGLVTVAAATAATGAAVQGVPLKIFEAHTEPVVIRPGGEFTIVYDIRRSRACSGAVDRFIVNQANTVVQTFERQPLGALKPGKRRKTELKLVLADLPPSTYTFRSIMTHDCPDGRYVQYSPDVPIVAAVVDDPWSTAAPGVIRTVPPGSVSLSPSPIVKVPK